jgi:rhodanese-related sulfurtransferase
MRVQPLISPLLTSAAVWVASTGAGGSITVGELQTQLTNQLAKVTVIDVRTPALFSRSHIPGAINIPASLCPQKNLPPLGKVVVCGEGLARDNTAAAVAALAAKPGLIVDVLEGGFAAWESAPTLTTRPGGMEPEAPNYITYSELKAAKSGDTLLVDLRGRAAPAAQTLRQNSAQSDQPPLTDLAREFPGLSSTRTPFNAVRPLSLVSSTAPPLLVLIDDGDGAAVAMARTLRGKGVKRYAILAGGETILARHGQPGLQRSSPAARPPNSTPQSSTAK